VTLTFMSRCQKPRFLLGECPIFSMTAALLDQDVDRAELFLDRLDNLPTGRNPKRPFYGAAVGRPLCPDFLCPVLRPDHSSEQWYK
jgi:hypothetical protein